LFPDGEGRDVCRTDAGETRGGEPKVSGFLVEERDQMVKIPSGREGREGGWSAESRRAALMGGHVWGAEVGDARPNSEEEKCEGGDRVKNDVVLRNVGGGKEGSGSVVTTVTVFFFFFFFFF